MINNQNNSRYSHGGAGGASTLSANRADDTGANAIWSRVRDGLRRQLGDAKFSTWIARLELVAEVNGEVLFAAAGEMERDRVRRDFLHVMQQEWTQNDAQDRKVAVKARAEIAPDVMALASEAIEEEGEDEGEIVVGRSDNTPETGLTLENFVVGESNRVAAGLAHSLAVGRSVSANVVTIVGPHGVGKTHLLQGIHATLRATKGESHALRMSAEEFTVAFIEGVKKKDTSDLRNSLRRAKVVLLDDFQFICSKPGTLGEFFSHLRAIVSNGGVVVLACDQTPAVLELDERMRDEIQGGVIAQMDLPERNLRREIIRAKVATIAATNDQFALEDEWVEHLADRLPSSGRALNGAVRNVYVGTILAGQPLTKAAVDKAIQLQLGGANLRPPKIDTIKDVTAKAYGVTKHDLESSCRKRQFAQPRQYAMYLARQLTTCSYPQIGRLFGDRDHTTVLFAFRKITKQVQGNEGFAEEMRQLEQRILADPRNTRQ
jgi:chromosomal replication initiator protein